MTSNETIWPHKTNTKTKRTVYLHSNIHPATKTSLIFGLNCSYTNLRTVVKSYKNNLLCKLTDWFPYQGNIGRVMVDKSLEKTQLVQVIEMGSQYNICNAWKTHRIEWSPLNWKQILFKWLEINCKLNWYGFLLRTQSLFSETFSSLHVIPTDILHFSKDFSKAVVKLEKMKHK